MERCQSTFQMRDDTLMTPDHTAIQARSSGSSQNVIGIELTGIVVDEGT